MRATGQLHDHDIFSHRSLDLPFSAAWKRIVNPRNARTAGRAFQESVQTFRNEFQKGAHDVMEQGKDNAAKMAAATAAGQQQATDNTSAPAEQQPQQQQPQQQQQQPEKRE